MPGGHVEPCVAQPHTTFVMSVEATVCVREFPFASFTETVYTFAETTAVILVPERTPVPLMSVPVPTTTKGPPAVSVSVLPEMEPLVVVGT